MASKQKVSIFWFRRDLRLFDNTALQQALDSRYPVLPIFIFDTNILDKLANKHDARVAFIYNNIKHLKETLETKGATLEVIHNPVEAAFKTLLEKYDVHAVFANKDYEPEAVARDTFVRGLLHEQHIPLHLFKDQVIFEGAEILKQDGSPFKVFTPYKKAWLAKFHQLKTTPIQDAGYDGFLQTKPLAMPDITSLGFYAVDSGFPPIEVATSLIKNYDQTRDFPSVDGTSRLGVHFRFGTISIREKALKAAPLNAIWLNELIWREFYSAILQHWPHVVTHSFHSKYDLIPWINDHGQFALWCRGMTGYPLVDAGMRELNATGYMHNRVRMVVASFLTKHLLIDWRWGERYFADKLLDYELASNNGGWQWAAGTGTDAQPYFRVFNPESQAAKFDPDKVYIKKWVPEFDTPVYPEPIVDHKTARERAIQTYKAVVS